MEQPELSELITRWEVPALPTILLAAFALVYIVGWVRAHRTRPAELPSWRLIAFLSGLGSLFVAISSPLDTFGESLLFMHMAQHFVLMSIAPPLLALGVPVVPLLRGMPRFAIRVLQPLFLCRGAHAMLRFANRTWFAWLAMNVTYVGWHIPAAYELALSSENWHNLEHICFFSTSLLFWWPVVQPWPSRRLKSQLLLIPYLVGADLVNTGVSAYLCFCGRLVYQSYADVQRPFPLSPLTDQVAAGSFMWVFGSMVFLIPVAMIIMRALSPQVPGCALSNHLRGEAA
jgi:cytochrome c oxidase assembly factor CtaG